MSNRVPGLKIIFFAFLVLLFFITPIAKASEKVQQTTIPITRWLKIGPINAPLPVFHEINNIKGKKFELKHLLTFDQFDIEKLLPKQGKSFRWDQTKEFVWTSTEADSDGFIQLTASEKALPQVFYLVAYIDAKRWTTAELQVTSPHLLQLYLDGKPIAKKTSSEKAKNDSTAASPGKASHKLKLETGKHTLVIKTLKDPGNSSCWELKAELLLKPPFSETDITPVISPDQRFSIKHLLDGPKVRSVTISPDGTLAALSLRQTLPPDDAAESWIEIRRVKDGSLVRTYRGGMKISRVQWAPAGRKFSYTSSSKKGSTLWIVDLDRGTATPILKNVKNFGEHSWAPNASYIVYSISEKPAPDKTGLKRLEGMPDRMPNWRKRSFLYQVQIPEGTRKRLTAGLLTTNLNCISPDSRKLLFSREVVDFSQRPYSKTEFFILDLATMKLDTLWTRRWCEMIQWSPDGKKLLITGGPSAFGKAGINIPDGRIPNEYDTQAYLYDLATGSVEAITRDFDPAIDRAVWSQAENCIYFQTTDRSYRHLYRYDLNKKSFSLVNTGVEVLNRFDLSRNKPLAVYVGCSATVPHKAYVIDLKKDKYRILADPEAGDFGEVRFGKIERWTFKNSRNVEIEGRVYYPPDFDASRKYPCIVYYYGGTSPVTRDFGGRYPKNLYAANGYVVYVLQPSGATGFGQEFSALHVNDWGAIVADEIIDGVKKFLAAHPFVDAERVGCIGASFGGFMTMLLLTRTDMFAAGIAHAGISSIASYWGEGYWGYIYSAVATANSFPWNRKDIYVGQSPLFRADKIKTPLLLLHGNVDTNVPPGESRQLFTALKLLGRTVELIEVEGQNHHIMAYNRRIRWTKSILAWFDKWLKQQPEWWDDMYPQLEKE